MPFPIWRHYQTHTHTHLWGEKKDVPIQHMCGLPLGGSGTELHLFLYETRRDPLPPAERPWIGGGCRGRGSLAGTCEREMCASVLVVHQSDGAISTSSPFGRQRPVEPLDCARLSAIVGRLRPPTLYPRA